MNKRAPKSRRMPRVPWQVIVFDLRKLRTRASLYWFIILLFVDFLSLCLVIYFGSKSGVLALSTVFSLVLAIAAFLFTIIDIVIPYFRCKEVQITKSSWFKELMYELQPSVVEKEYGYKPYFIKQRVDMFLMSDDVNEYIQTKGDEIELIVREDIGGTLIKRLQEKRAMSLNFLLEHYHKVRSVPGGEFYDDDKISLFDTPSVGGNKLVVYPSSYYCSYLTNSIAVSDVDITNRDGERISEFLSADYFPHSKLGSNYSINDLADSGLSNHMGANTLAITSDFYLVIWQQGTATERSQGKLAPSGSGSMDYSDFEESNNRSLNSVVIKAMNRELMEECQKAASTMFDIVESTIVIGYYRWCGEGGLPGFLGVTKLNSLERDLSPNTSEVKKPRLKMKWSVPDRKSLLAALDELMVDPNVSTPLYANALTLKKTTLSSPSLIDLVLGYS